MHFGYVVQTPEFWPWKWLTVYPKILSHLGPQEWRQFNAHDQYKYLMTTYLICTVLLLLAIRLPFGGRAEEDVLSWEGLILWEVFPDFLNIFVVTQIITIV